MPQFPKTVMSLKYLNIHIQQNMSIVEWTLGNGVKEEFCFLLNTFLYFSPNLSICPSPFFIVPYFYH